MSMLSSALSHLGISTGVQRAATTALGSVVGGPIGGVLTAAATASKLPSPFTGVVPPGGSSFINQVFGLAPTSGGGRIAPGPNGACPRGYHLNKHDLAAGKRVGAAARMTVCVRNRHMHALNSRAATRALRRLKRANKMTSKIHRLFHHSPRKALPGRKR